jgi:hypothetical protein
MKKKKKKTGAIPWKPLERAYYSSISSVARYMVDHGLDIAKAQEAMASMEDDEVWKNNQYQVALRRIKAAEPDNPDIVHLSIKRIDKGAAKDWRHFQWIKNQLLSPEHEAVELYPAESRLIDGANQYHLWAIDSPRFRFPFGFNEGRQVSNKQLDKGKQRTSHEYKEGKA